MGQEGREAGINLGVVCSSSNFPSILSSRNPAVERICTRPPEGGSCRNNQLSPLPGALVFCPKEKHQQTTGHPGPVDPQSFNFMPHVQDDVFARRPSCSFSRVLRCFHRSKGRVLAHPRAPPLQEVFGFQTQQHQISFSGHAIRPKRSTTHLYEDVQAYPERTSCKGSASTKLYRRLACLGKTYRRMRLGIKCHNGPVAEERISHKLGEVPLDPIPILSMAGNSMGYSEYLNVPSRRQGQISLPRHSCLF